MCPKIVRPTPHAKLTSKKSKRQQASTFNKKQGPATDRMMNHRISSTKSIQVYTNGIHL